MELPSKSEINRCGELLRKATFEGAPIDVQRLDHAIEVISAFRAAHAYPMAKTRYGLASMVRTERAAEVVVGQRLKRVPRIVRKLQRTVGTEKGRTALARLEDIGGVRAILRDGSNAGRRSQPAVPVVRRGPVRRTIQHPRERSRLQPRAGPRRRRHRMRKLKKAAA